MLLYHFLLLDQKFFLHQSLHYNLLFLHLEYSIFYGLFFDYHFQMLEQNAHLHPENLAQLNDLNLHFMLIMPVLLDIYSNLLFS